MATLHPLTHSLGAWVYIFEGIIFRPLSTMPSQRKHSFLITSRNSWYLRLWKQIAMDQTKVGFENSPARLVKRPHIIHPHSELKRCFFLVEKLAGWKSSLARRYQQIRNAKCKTVPWLYKEGFLRNTLGIKWYAKSHQLVQDCLVFWAFIYIMVFGKNPVD